MSSNYHLVYPASSHAITKADSLARHCELLPRSHEAVRVTWRHTTEAELVVVEISLYD